MKVLSPRPLDDGEVYNELKYKTFLFSVEPWGE